ncbi:hypothetical protein [Actinoalloteichus hymeniacidonis]|uniref:SWIM-type domain-containing protein n=1 Tax=Actinoalloteichus hymeniacidonis TaxID=340345 RepID=A0AAC9HSG3_9PSEU|nr:hypothetical protein [Actinoalloteichus hymeniacidonis]AOS64598.1 hypothetical protein TL08_19035 [Actinoalloteichus hymeniacidonis]MBB5907329.1 hypothetical protein [Actinoalloteichus hymeniacidonis]
MSGSLPPVTAEVPAGVLDALPPRLRKRIDGALDRAASWTIEVDGDTARAELDADTALTWSLHSGVLTSADELSCSCLLAPKCLHRGIAVAAAEVVAVESAAEPESVEQAPPAAETAPGPRGPAGSTSTVDPVVDDAVREPERQAAQALWQACSRVVYAGATGSGAVARAELLRAAHSARVAGLHRASAGGLRIAAALAAARANSSAFDREALTGELVELMLLCRELVTGSGPTDLAELRGTARREYRPIGTLRLYGLCTETVVAATGYSGVVTHLVDESGELWTVPAIMPGGAERVATAAAGPVAIGESGLSQRELGRGGLLLSGGTASPDGRLGAGRVVRAVAATGASWEATPLSTLWAQPLIDQVARAFEAGIRVATHRRAGADLLFVAGTVQGIAQDALRLSMAGDTTVDLVAAGKQARQNLRVLARATGTRLRVIARLLPDRPGSATALAISAGPDDLTLPTALRRHVDLGLDVLQRSYLHESEPVGLPPGPDRAERVPPPLRPLANVLHRVTLGGRAVAAVGSAAPDAAALVRNGLSTTAELLTELARLSRDRERDVFGRVVRDVGEDFPLAWLRAGLHCREFGRAAAHRNWLAAAGAA